MPKIIYMVDREDTPDECFYHLLDAVNSLKEIVQSYIDTIEVDWIVEGKETFNVDNLFIEEHEFLNCKLSELDWEDFREFMIAMKGVDIQFKLPKIILAGDSFEPTFTITPLELN